MMEHTNWTKQALAGNRLSTISEFQEHHFAERQGNAEMSKTHQTSKATEMLPGDKRQDSQRHPNTTGKFPAVLPAVHNKRSTGSPLKGTPWEDAATSSVTREKHRQLGRKRSVKEQEHIEFWLNFYG